MIDAGSPGKCSRKTALAIHFTLSLIAFLLCLLALISPSWQQVNLENGRTEHHHGLWLDCKRDYSFDYGRSRDYYKTLYKRDMQGSPFAAFFLPQLQCVYKFDYYIDQEDLYDHNHDENRIQNDAYQHLFLGWKIAALVGVGVGVLFAGCGVLMGVCAFCHRTFIIACNVIITIAALLGIIGNAIFYLYGNTQDNKVIKEEEENETYEQVLGWAYYSHFLGTLLLFFCSFMGCCVASISTGKSRSQLVSIELVENGDGSELLSSNGQNFKRSFSAVYKVDSSALRQWEKSYLKNAMSKGDVEHNFKRTASVPNFSKQNRKSKSRRSARQQSGVDFFSSTSNITEISHFGSNITMNTQQTRDTTQTAPAAVPFPVVPTTAANKPLKSALKTPTQARRELMTPEPVMNTYEYCDSTIGVSSFLGSRTPTRPNHPYDEVYETIPGEDYLEPKSVRNNRLSNSTLSTTDLETSQKMLQKTMMPVHGSSQSIPVPKTQKTTMIDDVAKRPVSYNEDGDPRDIHLMRIRERTLIEKEEREKFIKTALLPPPPPPTVPPKPKTIRDFGIDLSKESVGSYRVEDVPKSVSISTPSRLGAMLPPKMEERGTYAVNPCYDDSDDLPPPPEIALNTFAAKQKSITNLSFRGVLGGPSAAQQIFDRPDSLVSVSSSASNNKNDASRRPLTSISQHSLVNRRLLNVMPDEVDRSVGSSTILENEMHDSTTSYAQDAEVRLNLFMKDSGKNQDETTV